MTGEYDGCCCNQLDPPFTAARGSSWTTRVMRPSVPPPHPRPVDPLFRGDEDSQ